MFEAEIQVQEGVTMQKFEPCDYATFPIRDSALFLQNYRGKKKKALVPQMFKCYVDYALELTIHLQ